MPLRRQVGHEVGEGSPRLRCGLSLRAPRGRTLATSLSQPHPLLEFGFPLMSARRTLEPESLGTPSEHVMRGQITIEGRVPLGGDLGHPVGK